LLQAGVFSFVCCCWHLLSSQGLQLQMGQIVVPGTKALPLLQAAVEALLCLLQLQQMHKQLVLEE
jgi:hypothetical protein